VGSLSVDAARALPGPAWLVDRRTGAAERALAAPLPTSAQEVWRYSPVDKLDLDAYHPADPAPPARPELTGLAASLVGALSERSGLVVTVDGALAHAEGDGLRVEEASADLLGAVVPPHDALTDLHDAFAASPMAVVVPRGRSVAQPLVVVHVVTGGGVLACPRLVVHAQEGSEASVVEVFVGADDPAGALVLPFTGLVVEQGAHLRHAAVQALGPAAWSLGHAGSRVERDATLQSLVVALGGAYARLRTDSALTGLAAESTLLAVYVGDDDQVHDFRTMQEHLAPRTRSELVFKGAVGGRSHGVYSGLIRVHKGAKGTQAFQTNRNLVLSETAHADSVPNLEIDENDLACSHASAVGPIDPQQRFYLEARGVPPQVADRLIVLGFLDDVLARSPIPGLRGPIALELARRVEVAA
jgi:Fe-S cluster assembly protein SufD